MFPEFKSSSNHRSALQGVAANSLRTFLPPSTKHSDIRNRLRRTPALQRSSAPASQVATSPRSGPQTRPALVSRPAAAQNLTRISHLSELMLEQSTGPGLTGSEADGMRARGQRVGLVHLPDPRVGTPPSPHPWARGPLRPEATEALPNMPPGCTSPNPPKRTATI